MSVRYPSPSASRGAKVGQPGLWNTPPDTLSGVSGTLAYTNADDASSASGTTTILGALARTNADDTSAASGSTTVLGSLATTNAGDTSAASGTVGSGVVGTSATTNANDTAAGAGTTTVVGASATTNADDAMAGSGWAGIVSGSLATTNADDISSAFGSGGPIASVVTGGGRASRNYIIRGKKHFNLTNEQLCYLLAREAIEERAEVQVSYKNTKPHIVGKNAWQVLQDTIKSLEINATPFDENDDEAAAMLLL
jgi:hypothetical protein